MRIALEVHYALCGAPSLAVPIAWNFGDKLDSGRVWYLAMDEPASDILLVWPRADDLGRSYA